jgi:hypothetical protein
MTKAQKFAQHGGTARAIGVSLLRLWFFIIGLLVAVASFLYLPIQVMAHGEARTAMVGAGGKGMELLSGLVTAPGATFTAWTVATGNSLQIRSADTSSRVVLLGAWAWNQVAGTLRIRSPRLHDFQQGIRMRVPVNNVGPMYPPSGDTFASQLLIPQDTLTVEQTGSGVGGQIETGSLLVWYDSLPGIGGRFISPDVLQKSGVNVIGQEVSITTGVAGGYSGQVAINSSFDNFKANTDYALVGYMTDTRVCSVRFQGIDTGNLGVGGPGDPAFRDVQNDWFIRLSNSFNLPMIPVFNSANKSAILVDATAQQVAVTSVVTAFMVELAPGAAPGGTGK